MRIRLVAIGNKLPQWIEQGSQDYLKRLPREFAFELIEIPLGHRGKNADIDRAMRQEGQAMLKHVEPSDWVVALEVLGKNWSSEQLAERLFISSFIGIFLLCQQTPSPLYSPP